MFDKFTDRARKVMRRDRDLLLRVLPEGSSPEGVLGQHVSTPHVVEAIDTACANRRKFRYHP